MEEKNFSAKRIENIVLMLGMTVLLSVALGLTLGFFVDQIIADIIISILFFMLLVFCLIHGRVAALIADNPAVDYTVIRNIYCIFCFLVYGFSFLPEYTAPVIILPLFLAAVSDITIGMTAGIYFDILLCLTVHADFYELCAYVFLSLFGCVLVGLLEEKKNRIALIFIIPCMNMVISVAFHFLADYSFDVNLLIYTGISGILTDLLIVFLFDRIKQYAFSGKSRSLEEIMREDYPLLAEIRSYSKTDYRHAKKVSELCERCASLISADPAVVKAAGFYYRLGKIEGEKPYVENGVLLAQSNCFPAEVIKILSEYNGELALPSTQESALVHMVDTLVTKFEILDKNTVSSTWNYEVIIYQTMNEKSATGIYDKSGLTMNQFLKIREFFVKGEKLF